MAFILISHKRECGREWRPFNGKKDVVKILESVWDHDIVDSRCYLYVKLLLKDELKCKCRYPPNTRPVAREHFDRYHGCVFDLDAYFSGEDYLVEEVESLPKTVYAGGISNQYTNYIGTKPNVSSLYEEPIKDKEGIALYLHDILIQIYHSLRSLNAKFDEPVNKNQAISPQR